MITVKARLTALKWWEVPKPQFAPMSVNGLGNWVFKLDGIKCICWRTNNTKCICWRTNNTNQLNRIFETKYVGNIFNNYVFPWGTSLARPVLQCPVSLECISGIVALFYSFTPEVLLFGLVQSKGYKCWSLKYAEVIDKQSFHLEIPFEVSINGYQLRC